MLLIFKVNVEHLNKNDMKIEVKITDDDDNVHKYDISDHLFSDKVLKIAANIYAENENSCYTNDYHGYLRGAMDVRDLFIPKLSER